MFSLCPFSKVAWFASPWYITSEILTHLVSDMTTVKKNLLTSGHHFASIKLVFSMLWCLWKLRNDSLFNRKCIFPFSKVAGHLLLAQISCCLSLEVANFFTDKKTLAQAGMPGISCLRLGTGRFVPCTAIFFRTLANKSFTISYSPRISIP